MMIEIGPELAKTIQLVGVVGGIVIVSAIRRLL